MVTKIVKYRITATVGKKKKKLGVFKWVSSVDRIIKKAKETKKNFPFSEKATIIIQPIRNGRKSGKAIIKKIS